MFTPLRHALSLAVGSALAVSASGAFAGPDGSVFGQSYAQYFGGVGAAGAAYDGTQDILNWKPTEITLPDETSNHRTNLLLADNSHWAVTDDSFVTTLKADSDSDVEILAGTAEKQTKLSIDKLDSGVRVNVNDNTSLTVGEQTAEPAAAVLADDVPKTYELDVRFKGLENADVVVQADNVSTKLVASANLRDGHDDDTIIRAMAEAVDTKEETVRFELEQGLFSDGVSGTVSHEDGTLQVNKTNRTTNENALAVADTGSILFMQWRAETDDVMQRMGDVRSSGKTGLWVRHYGGRSEFGSSDYDYLALQMGADRLVYDGDVKVLAGAAFSYTDGDAKYSTGTSDAKSYAFTAYGELLTQSGSFLSAALKYGALRNEVELSKTIDGEFRADAWAFSVETGHRFALAKSFFVEPHVGLTYAKVNGDSFRVGDNASVKQDDFDSLVGGVGLTLGFSCPNDRGDVYLRLDQKYDFQGETSTGFYSNGREVNRFDKDLGGSWFEIGLGAKARLTESLTGYAEFETAHSGEVETPFRWNLGLRYTF